MITSYTRDPSRPYRKQKPMGIPACIHHTRWSFVTPRAHCHSWYLEQRVLGRHKLGVHNLREQRTDSRLAFLQTTGKVTHELEHRVHHIEEHVVPHHQLLRATDGIDDPTESDRVIDVQLNGARQHHTHKHPLTDSATRPARESKNPTAAHINRHRQQASGVRTKVEDNTSFCCCGGRTPRVCACANVRIRTALSGLVLEYSCSTNVGKLHDPIPQETHRCNDQRLTSPGHPSAHRNHIN